MFKKLANRILDNVESVVVREASKAITPHLEKAASGAINAIINEAPTARSTGGATSVHLTKIQSDFKDFHADDAEAIMQTFILELLQIKYCGQEGFEHAKVSDKIILNIGNKGMSRLSDVKVNQIAISDYKKSLNSATITYRISTGFSLGGNRQEKLYEVEYTLQLRDAYGEMKFLKCENCGAPLKEESGECDYCGMKHLRDTISNWVITSVVEK